MQASTRCGTQYHVYANMIYHIKYNTKLVYYRSLRDAKQKVSTERKHN